MLQPSNSTMSVDASVLAERNAADFVQELVTQSRWPRV